jgi:hypothetical protein
MATIIIEGAGAMRGHAETYVVHAIMAELEGRDPTSYLDSARYCRAVADAIDAGKVAVGAYEWKGTHGEFQAALLAGSLAPATGEG